MNAKEYYEKTKKVGTYEQNFSGWDMIKFAEAYHAEKIRSDNISEILGIDVDELTQYVDVALRIHKIQLSLNILETTIKCLELVYKTKGLATIDEVLAINKEKNKQ